MFIAALSSRSATEKRKTVAFSIPKANLQDISQKAERIGLFVDANSDTGLLIIGERLADVKEMRKCADQGTGGSKLAFVKGAVIGASLAFIGLAAS